LKAEGGDGGAPSNNVSRQVCSNRKGSRSEGSLLWVRDIWYR